MKTIFNPHVDDIICKWDPTCRNV